MSIIHGSMGLVYFVHEWEPKFRESALLSDPEMLAAVTAINRQITALAPVLNSPTIAGGATASSDQEGGPVAVMMKRYEDATYLFAVAMRDKGAAATFTIQGAKGETTVEVMGEKRTLTSTNGVFKDRFDPYAVHLYRVK